MRARNRRDRRAWKGRYFLRDLAGFAAIERLLAADIVRKQLYTDVIDPDAPPTSLRPAKAEVGERGTEAPSLRRRHRPNGELAAELRRALGHREPGSAQLLSLPLDLRALRRLAAGHSSPGTAQRR